MVACSVCRRRLIAARQVISIAIWFSDAFVLQNGEAGGVGEGTKRGGGQKGKEKGKKNDPGSYRT